MCILQIISLFNAVTKYHRQLFFIAVTNHCHQIPLCHVVLQDAIDQFSFVPFAVMLLASLIFVVLFAPETKGKRIEDITLLFKAPDEQSQADLTSSQSYQHLPDNRTGGIQWS